MPILIDVIKLSKQKCTHPLQGELAYATPNNLVGRVIDGYHAEAKDICLLTPKAAQALCEVQNELAHAYHLGLYIFDAYRPKRAVLDFIQWTQAPIANDFELERKAMHYPHIEKNKLFELGYFSDDSNHCYGNTVDLVLIDLRTNEFLDMGAIFDYMDDISHLTATVDKIGEAAYRNRKLLTTTMEKFGFESYINEFWHFCHGGRAGAEVSEAMDIEIIEKI